MHRNYARRRNVTRTGKLATTHHHQSKRKQRGERKGHADRSATHHACTHARKKERAYPVTLVGPIGAAVEDRPQHLARSDAEGSLELSRHGFPVRLDDPLEPLVVAVAAVVIVIVIVAVTVVARRCVRLVLSDARCRRLLVE